MVTQERYPSAESEVDPPSPQADAVKVQVRTEAAERTAMVAAFNFRRAPVQSTDFSQVNDGGWFASCNVIRHQIAPAEQVMIGKSYRFALLPQASNEFLADSVVLSGDKN